MDGWLSFACYVNRSQVLTSEQKNKLLKMLIPETFAKRFMVSSDTTKLDSLNTFVMSVERFNQALDSFVAAKYITKDEAEAIKTKWDLPDSINTIFLIQGGSSPSGFLSGSEVRIALKYLANNLDSVGLSKLTNTMRLLLELSKCRSKVSSDEMEPSAKFSLSAEELKQILDDDNHMLRTLQILGAKEEVCNLVESRGINLAAELESLELANDQTIKIRNIYALVRAALRESTERISDLE